MSQLLEILGRGIAFDITDLIWHWFDLAKSSADSAENANVQQLNKVIELMGDKKFEAAENQLKLYLFDNPDCTRGRLAAAAICLHKNQLQNAVEELNSVYMRQPNNTIALYTLGHCCERLGKPSEAIEFYQDCLKFKNHLQLPRERLAAIYFKNSQLKKTIAEYELLKGEYPDDISTLVLLGHLYIATEEYPQAVETFNTAILIHPDNFYGEVDDIDQLIIAGEYQHAAQQLEQMLDEEPERLDLIVKYADVLAGLGLPEQSASQYEHALGICPNFLEAAIKLGTQYLYLNQIQLAAQQFNRAVEINDRIVDAYVGLAIAQKLAGDIDTSLTTLSLAAAIQPNSSLLFAQTATLQFKAELGSNMPTPVEPSPEKLLEAVIGAHRQQLTIQPQNPDLYYRLGVLMTTIGNFNDAIKAFQTVLDINPTYTRAKGKLAICLLADNQKEAAAAQISPHSNPGKNMLEMYYKIALMYCDRLKFASSLLNLEQNMAENFTSTDITSNISIVLQNLGLLDRAAIMWDNLADTVCRAVNNHQ
jgi:tetratricopeptide (TPR) repeat protein